MRTVRIGLLMMVVVGAGLLAPAGVVADAKPSAETVSAESAAEFLSDFDGDGLKDLAVGVPGEDVGSVPDAGGVQVIYASSNGLTAAGNQFWTQDSPGIFGEAEAYDEFGDSLAVADFDGDGFSDLAVGVPGEDAAEISDVGGVHVIYGSPSGLTSTSSQFWNQNSTGILDEAEDGDSFGDSLAAANFGKSFRADLAVGVPYESAQIGLSKVAGCTSSTVRRTGSLRTGSQFWTQDSAGIIGAAETIRRFRPVPGCRELRQELPR